MHARIITTQGQFLAHHGDEGARRDSWRLLQKVQGRTPIYCHSTPSRGGQDEALVVRFNPDHVVAIEEVPE